jgi:hypothetical protein
MNRAGAMTMITSASRLALDGFDVLLYGRPEGMTIEHCVLSAAFDREPTTCRDLCVQKHTNVELTDPAGYTFPVATDSNCRNRLLHSRPIEGSEFVIKAAQLGAKTSEIPITLWKDKRGRPPHLRSFRDGWRHLRFMLLYAPNWLFLLPGGVLMAIGLGIVLWLLPGPILAGRVGLNTNSMSLAIMLVLLGMHIFSIGLFVKVFCYTEKLARGQQTLVRWLKHLRLEHGLLLGAAVPLGDSLADRESNSSARHRFTMQPLEHAKHLVPILGRNTDAIVLHVDFNQVSTGGQIDLNHDVASLRGELDSIIQEVGQDLPDSVAVSSKMRELVSHPHLNRLLFLCCQRPSAFHHLMNQRSQV